MVTGIEASTPAKAAVPVPKAVTEGAGDDEPDVVLVAVTYNSADIIERFLRALPEAVEGIRSVRVVIVDNASSDGTADVIRQVAPWVSVLGAGGNLGYGAGLNVGLRRGLGRYGVLMLNPDAVLAPGSVARLLDAVEMDDSVGISVPRIVDAGGRLKFSLRREPTLLRAVGEALLGGHRAAKFSRLGDMIRDPDYYTDGATADWATGAAMFVGRRTIDAVGLFDERYFLYSEETDYALRTRDAGLRLRYVADAVVTHPGGDMQTSAFLWSLVAVNRVRLYRKRHSGSASAVYWVVVTLNEATRALLGRPRHRAALRALLRRRSPMPAEKTAAPGAAPPEPFDGAIR